jgi:hypothetical protein
VFKEDKELLVQPVLREQRDHRVLQVQQGVKVLQEHRDQRELQALKVYKDFRE